MVESIIGTILLAASTKRNYTIYHVMFTDNRVLAIEAQIAGAENNQPNPFANNPIIGELASVAIMGAMGGGRGINLGAPAQMAKMQGMARWNNAKNACAGKPVVDYNQKEVTDEMLSLGNISIPYEKIKQVTFKKELVQSDFNLSFSEGIISSETFVVQGDAASAVSALLEKTPIAEKIKK